MSAQGQKTLFLGPRLDMSSEAKKIQSTKLMLMTIFCNGYCSSAPDDLAIASDIIRIS